VNVPASTGVARRLNEIAVEKSARRDILRPP
jgi:hypothetical protein